MRLHRLSLSNYRGTTEREIAFADGVTVVEGRNEVGKSTLVEALRHLRIHKAGSKRVEVRATQPVGRDAGPQVTAELSTGAYRLTYTKRWLKSPMAELHIAEPRVEHLVGDAAHERFLALLAETSDVGLFEALEVLQGQSLGQPQLAQLPPLRRALDSAGTDADEHGDLLNAIEKEYTRYFTPTGRATGDYLRAETELARLQERVDEADEASRVVENLTDQVRQLTQGQETTAKRLKEAKAHVAELEEANRLLDQLRTQAAEAEREVTEATEALEQARAANQMRIDLAALVGSLMDQTQDATANEAQCAMQERVAREAMKYTQRQVTEAEEREVVARQAKVEAELALARARQAIERTQLLELLHRVRTAQDRLGVALQTLEHGVLTAEQLAELEELEVQHRLAETRWHAGAATVQLSVWGEVTMDDEALSSGELGPLAVQRPMTLEVPNQLRLIITPGRGDEDMQHDAATARENLADALADHGLVDLAEARAVAARSAQAAADRDAAQATIDNLLAGRNVDQLAARAAALETSEEPCDEHEALVHLQEVEATLFGAVSVLDRAREQLEARRASHAAAQESWIRADAYAAGVASRLTDVQAQLETARARCDDQALEQAIVQAEDALAKQRERQRHLAEELREADSEALETLLVNAKAVVDRANDEAAELEAQLVSTHALLADRLTRGPYDELATARSELQEAMDRQASRRRAAEAVKLLRATLLRHRAEAERRYVGPFRERLEALGRLVFGPSLDLEVAPDLTLTARTLGGTRVPFDSLSSGAKEQLSLLGRLACAQLVQPGEGVPVIIDDALGFADPERLTRLGAVLRQVGDTAQIIILTCQPERFGNVGNASLVRL